MVIKVLEVRNSALQDGKCMIERLAIVIERQIQASCWETENVIEKGQRQGCQHRL